jgi:hypothetical protein
MIIIGADYHPGFQQIAFVDMDTGLFQERREEAEKFHRDLAAQTGSCEHYSSKGHPLLPRASGVGSRRHPGQRELHDLAAYRVSLAKESGPHAGRGRTQFSCSAPGPHKNRLSKRMYKKPEYCAACHKHCLCLS